MTNIDRKLINLWSLLALQLFVDKSTERKGTKGSDSFFNNFYGYQTYSSLRNVIMQL